MLGLAPFAHHRHGRNLQHFSRFLNAQATEETQFDDLAFPRVDNRQRVQGIVERD